MAYYEFLNIPDDDSVEDKAGREGDNPWSEVGNGENLTISYSVDTQPDDRSWIGTGPRSIGFTITRIVKTHSNDIAKNSEHIEVGDLLLYRLATLCIKEDWTVERGKEDSWPKAYIELDTQNGVRLRADIERLVIDSWSMSANASDNGDLEYISESLSFRGWVMTLENSSGSPTKIALKL